MEEQNLPFKKGDRVKRKDGKGALGIVEDIREEVTKKAGDPDEQGLLVSVQWDNGTFSYFAPESLEAVKS